MLEMKSDLVSMVIEHFRVPWWLLKEVKLTCGSRFSSNGSRIRTRSSSNADSGRGKDALSNVFGPMMDLQQGEDRIYC